MVLVTARADAQGYTHCVHHMSPRSEGRWLPLSLPALHSAAVLEEGGVDERASSNASTAPSEHATTEDGQSAAAEQDVADVVTSPEDMALVRALRAGDETAFATLVMVGMHA